MGPPKLEPWSWQIMMQDYRGVCFVGKVSLLVIIPKWHLIRKFGIIVFNLYSIECIDGLT